MEAIVGIEPTLSVLQTPGWPLTHIAVAAAGIEPAVNRFTASSGTLPLLLPYPCIRPTVFTGSIFGVFAKLLSVTWLRGVTGAGSSTMSGVCCLTATGRFAHGEGPVFAGPLNRHQ